MFDGIKSGYNWFWDSISTPIFKLDGGIVTLNSFVLLILFTFIVFKLSKLVQYFVNKLLSVRDIDEKIKTPI